MQQKPFPAGVLRNTKASLFHPIVFRRAPMPSEGGCDENAVQRHKSIGHHTDGFATLAEAQAHIATQKNWEDKGVVWAWDGEESAHMVFWF